MNSFFGKKKKVQTMAEVLEDGRKKASAAMDHPKYRDYAGKEPMIEVRVRVQPVSDPPFESTMKAALTLSYLLLPGVQVKVLYNAAKQNDVVLEDDLSAILGRNPQLVKSDSSS